MLFFIQTLLRIFSAGSIAICVSRICLDWLLSSLIQLCNQFPGELPLLEFYRLRAEVEAVIGDHIDVQFEDLAKLTYTSAVRKWKIIIFTEGTNT